MEDVGMQSIDNIIIQPLKAEHIPELVQLEKEIFSIPWSEKAFADLLGREYCHYQVALLSGKVVGIAGMVVLAGEGDIDKVMVDPQVRRCGIADKLLAQVFREGEALGVDAYTLEVRCGNLPAIRLYEKNGFISEGIRPRFYEKPVEDAVIMWKRS